jgi:hypothetical protein
MSVRKRGGSKEIASAEASRGLALQLRLLAREAQKVITKQHLGNYEKELVQPAQEASLRNHPRPRNPGLAIGNCGRVWSRKAGPQQVIRDIDTSAQRTGKARV